MFKLQIEVLGSLKIIFFVVTKFESFTPRFLSEKNGVNKGVYTLYTTAD